jgi:hypothetical protein
LKRGRHGSIYKKSPRSKGALAAAFERGLAADTGALAPAPVDTKLSYDLIIIR